MNQNDSEIKKAVALLVDKTYNEDDFCSHIAQILNQDSAYAEEHKNQLERLMFKVEELLDYQRQYHSGNKRLLGTCKSKEQDLYKKVIYLKTAKGYNSDRFKENQAEQKKIF